MTSAAQLITTRAAIIGCTLILPPNFCHGAVEELEGARKTTDKGLDLTEKALDKAESRSVVEFVRAWLLKEDHDALRKPQRAATLSF